MKKIVTWATPRKLQPKWNESDTRWHSKVKKFCKGTKGEHQFTIKEIRDIPWANGRFIHYTCICGKKKIEWEDTK